MPMWAALLCSFSLCVAGCASKLVVSDGNKSLQGIPVGAPLLVAIETTTPYSGAPTLPKECPASIYCSDLVTSETKFLPLGKTYYVTFEPAALAKSEFSLTFAESGVLTGLSLNSTPSAESLTGLLDTVLPYVAAPAAAGGPDQAPPPVEIGKDCPLPPKEVFEKHCIRSGPPVTRVRKIEVE